MCDLLLAQGADVNAKNESGSTPLHGAAYFGHTAVVGLLLAHGADPSASTRPIYRDGRLVHQGETPLDHAWQAGFADTVAALGGDPNDTNLADNGPFMVVVTNQQQLRHFIWSNGLQCDDVWTPSSADIEGLEDVIRSFLQNNRVIAPEFGFDREYVLRHLRRYNREYGGVVDDGIRRVLCQLWLDLDEFSAKPSSDYFHGIMDGGCSVVRVVFDEKTKAIIHIECNGQ